MWFFVKLCVHLFFTTSVDLDIPTFEELCCREELCSISEQEVKPDGTCRDKKVRGEDQGEEEVTSWKRREKANEGTRWDGREV